MTDFSIPISTLQLGTEEEQLVLEVLRSGQLAQGPMVRRLETAFEEVTKTKHAIAVTSGTTALVAAIQALELERGSEVITSPFTFIATLNAIIEAGAVARFVDIGDDFNLDAKVIDNVITERTRALLPVHLYGYPADMDTIIALAQERGLAVIEDAAQAIGATFQERPVGSFGIGCFSLYATKSVTTGEGGMITTNDEAIANRVRVLRNQGMRFRYQYEIPGHNYRMTDLQAAVGIPQMARLALVTERRRLNAERLTEGLLGIRGLLLPFEEAGRTHVFHQFTIRVTEEARLNQHELATRLTEQGIGAGIYYPRVVYDYDCYRDHPQVIADPVPNASRIAKEVLSLPVHPALTEADLDRIVTAVKGALG